MSRNDLVSVNIHKNQLKQNLENIKKKNPLFDSEKSTKDLEKIYCDLVDELKINKKDLNI